MVQSHPHISVVPRLKSIYTSLHTPIGNKITLERTITTIIDYDILSVA